MIEELGNFLEAGGGGTQGADLFLNGLPADPDAAVAIQEYSGEAPGLVHGTAGVSEERRRFQLLARAVTLAAAVAKAQAAHALLCQVHNTTLSGTWYVGIYPLQSPFPLGRDENGRARVVCNYRVEKAPSA